MKKIIIHFLKKILNTKYKQIKITNRLRPMLMELQKSGKKELIGVEIGISWGLNAQNILSVLPIKKLYLVDPYENQESTIINQDFEKKKKKEAKKRLKKYKNKIEFIYDLSEKAVSQIKNDELDFVYIDGNHKYEFVKKDIRLYYPKVKKGGIIGGHDYSYTTKTKKLNYDVVGATGDFFKNKNEEVYFENMDWWVIKK